MMLWLVRKEKEKDLSVYRPYDWSVYFFRRLKINHVSHEFIFEFGTVANKNHYVVYYFLRKRLLFFIFNSVLQRYNYLRWKKQSF